MASGPLLSAELAVFLEGGGHRAHPAVRAPAPRAVRDGGGEYRDNLESRLVLLKRRRDEREAPVRIEKTGRGRFRLVVDGRLRLDEGSG